MSTGKLPTPAAIATTTLMLAPDIALHAWAFSVLWGWFVTPVFGVSITVGQAAGLIILKLSLSTRKAPDVHTFKDVVRILVDSWVEVGWFLFLGAIVHAVIS